MNGTTPAIASTQMFDTTFTFVANTNYTFFLYGTARTGVAGGTPDPAKLNDNGARCCQAMIVTDDAVAPTKIGLRVINLAPTLASAGNQPGVLTSPVDISISNSNGAFPATPVAGGTLTNLGLGNISAYAAFDTSTIAAAAGAPPYRMVVTAVGTTSPVLFAATLPVGLRGSATTNPTAGTNVPGTSITAVIVPRSVPGSQAPAVAAATTAANGLDSIIRSNDTVTAIRTLTGGSPTTCASPNITGAAVGDVVNITGATQPEYNGSYPVISITAGVAGVVTGGTCTTQPIRARFRYRIAGTPATPATGAPIFRQASSALLQALDYSTPGIIFLIDIQPPRTAP